MEFSKVYRSSGSGNTVSYIKSEIIIPANSTVVADVNLLASFTRLEYIMNFKDSPLTVSKSLKMVGLWNGSVLIDTVSERQGGPLNVSVDLTEDSVDAFLSVQNNESFNLTLTLLKSKI